MEFLSVPGKTEWLKFSGEARFRHRELATELFETIARAYGMEETCQ